MAVIMDTKRLGRIVRFHRKQARLTQVGLARLAGVGKTAIFDIEHGKATVRLDTLMRLLRVLNITLEVESPLMGRFVKEEEDHATG